MRDKASGRKLKFSHKLYMGLVALSAIGLVVIFIIVNTVVRDIIFDKVIGIAQRDMAVYADEIEHEFIAASQTVFSLAAALKTLPSEHYFADIAESFVDTFEFVENVFIGFTDGSVINGTGWIPDQAESETGGVGWGPWENWVATDRPWFLAAYAAGEGNIAITDVYMSHSTGNITLAMGTWLPGLSGVGASVGFSISIEGLILDNVRTHPVMADGYLILTGVHGEIIFHPNPAYNPGLDGLHNLSEIPGGEFMSEALAGGMLISEFDDTTLGRSHFIATQLETVGWTLISVIPIEATIALVFQNLSVIMIALTIVVVLLFAFTIFFVSFLTRKLEDNRVLAERLHIIIDNMPLGCNFLDENRQISYCNQAAVTLYGLDTQQDFIDRFSEFMPEFQPDGRRSADVGAEHSVTAYEQGYSRIEWTHSRPDGTPLPVESTLIRVKLQDDKYILLNFMRDLTEHFKLKEIQAEDQRRLKAMLDASPMVCAIFDENARILDANLAAATMFGLSDRHVYIDRFFELSPEFQPDGIPSREKVPQVFKMAFDTGRAHFEWMHKTLDDISIPCEVTLERVQFGEKDVIIAYVRDLREQQDMLGKLEAALDGEYAATNALKYRERLLNTLNQTAEVLLTAKEEYIMNALMAGVEIVGSSLDLDRVQLWRNEEINGELHFTLKRQWSSEFGKQKEEILIGMSYSYADRPGWFEMFSRGESINSPVAELPPEDMDLLSFYGIKSIAMLPLFLNNEFIGFFGVDDCRRERTLTDDEMDMLASAGLMFTSVFNRLEQAHMRAEIEMERDAHELKEIFLSASPFIMNIWDDSYNLVSTSQQSVEMFKLSSQKQYIERFFELSPEFQPCGERSDTKALNFVKQAFGQDERVKFEWTHQTLTGELVPTEVTLARFKRHGQYFVAAYTVDLRPIKAAAEESSKAKSRFLARMSHEIRTPITAVLGISEIQLQNPALPPEIEESFAKIHDSSNVLLGIVNDILDMSKIESEKLSLVLEEYEVSSMISEAIQPHTVNLGGSGIEFRVHVDSHLPKFLVGDPLRIKQIMNNVLSNAFKYTEAGSVDLLLQCQKDEEKEDYVTLWISVRDTGLGMAPEQLGALFKEEYVRFHELEARYVTGTGLGMGIVYSLVQLMDADVNVQSEVGKGTTVDICIPQKIAGGEILGKEMAESLARFELSARSAAKRFQFVPEPMPYGRVLVVDDVDANLYVAQGLLAFYQLDIEICDSGYAAIEKIKNGKVYDIVFLDYMMPGMDGNETMHIMRDMGYTDPIVALTANAMIGKAEEFIQNGFDGFISKPIQTVHLNTILKKHIRDKQPPEVLEAAKASSMLAEQNGIHDYLSSADLVDRLREDFARSHKNAIEDIRLAISADDIKTAHRLAHTLKGSAGLIHEHALAELVGQIELLLADAKIPDDNQLSGLESELTRVLDSVGRPELTVLPSVLDRDKAIDVFDRLEELLSTSNAESLNLLGELSTIPETAVLVRLIEEFDFAQALKNLKTLKEVFGI